MVGFILRRLIAALLVMLTVSLLVFLLFYKGISNPAQPICDGAGGRCTPEKLAAIEHQMGLDQPVLKSYGEYMVGIVKGRTINQGGEFKCEAPCLGISYGTQLPVWDELKQKFPATLSLAVGGSIIFLTLGVLLGVLAARWRGTVGDRLLVSTSLLISAIPYYLVALLGWIFLTLQWQVFPETGYFGWFDNPAKTFAGLLLPCLVMGIASAPNYSRFTRGQMVETMGEDFVRTSAAKGLSNRTVIFKHALRAAIVPVVTIFGLEFGALLAGTIFTERIFDIDGIGQWGLNAVQAPMDLPVLVATVMVGAFFIILSNLVVDIVYGFLDPRVRIG